MDTVKQGKGTYQYNQKEMSGRKLGDAIRNVQRERERDYLDIKKWKSCGSKCAKDSKGNRRKGVTNNSWLYIWLPNFTSIFDSLNFLI